VCEDKLAHIGVQGEAIHAVTNCQHKGVAAGVQAVAGNQQVTARLAHVGHAGLQRGVQDIIHNAALIGLIDTEDGADADAWGEGVWG
jgi:hypothetical protein